MPRRIVLTEKNETEVSDQDYRKLLNEVRSGRRSHLISEAPTEKEVTVLWDTVDGSKLVLPTGIALSNHVKKLVFKCSNCNYTLPALPQFQGTMKNHVEQVLESYRQHQGATLGPVEPNYIEGRGSYGMGSRCSGCGGVYQVKRNQGQRHLAAVLAEGPRHQQDVEELLIRRYALEPSEPVVLRRTAISVNGHEPSAGLEGAQVERRHLERKRKRHRRHNRRRSRGNKGRR